MNQEPRPTLAEIIDRAIREAVRRHKGNRPDAAQELGISLRTIYNRIGKKKKTRTTEPGPAFATSVDSQ